MTQTCQKLTQKTKLKQKKLPKLKNMSSEEAQTKNGTDNVGHNSKYCKSNTRIRKNKGINSHRYLYIESITLDYIGRNKTKD